MYDVAIIGAGPGGYVSAIRARQLGLTVALVERDQPGGVCLNWGCIPSKALIHSADLYRHLGQTSKWGVKVDLSSFDYAKVHKESRTTAATLSRGVQGLIKKNKIDYFNAQATITGPQNIELAYADGKKESLSTKNILIATGSRPREIPGYAFDGKRFLSSTDMLSLTQLPKKLAILGAGAIGIEFAFVANAFGVEVHMIEMLPQILPNEDSEIASALEKSLLAQGIKIYTSTRAETPASDKTKVSIPLVQGEKKTTLEVDAVLVAVGRIPNTENIGLENIKLQTEKGFIPVGDYYRTKVNSVFAIGDVVATPLLAHVASKEGEIAVEHIANKSPEKSINLDTIPSAVYAEPQVASFGKREDDLKKENIEYHKSVFPYRGAGKSIAVNASEGFVKLLSDKKTHEILGCHILGKDATEIIHELLLAKHAELLPEDIASMVHAHPTIFETVMEASKGVDGAAIHA